ncbi:dolichol-phosphate mannosyltransferase subunit 3 [Pseudophryne corroboree]|uniref:dolichol-phosphate mannosyltransferase subunit 3 n=1 Tax=Pseudophryne corroboree TaxID=495146 RepID=UPI003081F4B1
MRCESSALASYILEDRDSAGEERTGGEEAPASDMTKLAEWLLGLMLLGGVWVTLTLDLLGLELPVAYREVIWPLPVYLLVTFGCYSLATVGYRVATFNDCEEAAQELQDQIKEAKRDLSRRGLRL